MPQNVPDFLWKDLEPVVNRKDCRGCFFTTEEGGGTCAWNTVFRLYILTDEGVELYEDADSSCHRYSYHSGSWLGNDSKFYTPELYELERQHNSELPAYCDKHRDGCEPVSDEDSE